MLTKSEFCYFYHLLPWKQSKMAAKQQKLFEVCVKGIACLTNMIAEINTDANYVYFVTRILSFVAFCIFYEFSYLLLFEHQQKLLNWQFSGTYDVTKYGSGWRMS